MSASKPRILFCRSNPIAPDPRVQKEAGALARAGYAVSVISWDRSASLPIYERVNEFDVHRLRIRSKYASGLMNLPHLFRWQFFLMKWIISHRSEFDTIHACDFDTVLPAIVAKRLWGKRVIYDIFDFYADHLRRTPRWIKTLIRKLDLHAINQVDGLILCDDSRVEQIKGSQPSRTTIIYNTPIDIQFSEQNFVASPAGSLRLAYVGLIQVERGLFDILNVMHRHPEWSLELAGFGGDENRVVDEVAKMANVTWYSKVSYARALEINNSSDLMFALYDPAIANHRFSSANKIFEAMMLAKPVLVAENTNMDRIVASCNSGVVVKYGDIPAIEQALVQLAADPLLRVQLGVNGRTAYEKEYSWSVMEKRLLDLYQTLG